MKFATERLKVKDERMLPFIDNDEIEIFLKQADPQKEIVRGVIAKSLRKERLTLLETATLINARDPDLVKEIKQAAQKLKEIVYGSRLVLFAPLYVGNQCINDCKYCGFRSSNKNIQRETLTNDEIIKEVKALEEQGHKRLILVFSEHPAYDPEFISKAVETTYKVKSGNGSIRRVNINAAPLDIEGFRTVGKSGIGTYQVFQETYHEETYANYHPSGPKKDYNWRLTALDRANEAGIDDVGIGVLLGLYDWRFEVMALIRHANHLEAVYGVGPHTVSFPRIQPAANLSMNPAYLVSDEDFTRLVAILRLAIPYTGLILTAREPEYIRNEVLDYGVSQIDAGTNIELHGYTGCRENEQNLNKEQFYINDSRSLDTMISYLLSKDQVPSFCTSCYRKGRTGEHFMDFSVPGFIKNFCSPNAVLTFAEYLEDYASEDVKTEGYKVLKKELSNFPKDEMVEGLIDRLDAIRAGKRDIFY